MVLHEIGNLDPLGFQVRFLAQASEPLGSIPEFKMMTVPGTGAGAFLQQVKFINPQLLKIK